MYKYSISKNTFYIKGVNDKDNSGKSIVPKDVVSVSEEDFVEFTKVSPDGCLRGWDGEKLVWKPLELDTEDLIFMEEIWVSEELDKIRNEIERLEDEGSSQEDIQSLREYRKAVRLWNQDEKFPLKEYRPTPNK